MTANQPVLSNLQIELLKLYANGVSDKQLLEIKWMLVQYFADKATEVMDRGDSCTYSIQVEANRLLGM